MGTSISGEAIYPRRISCQGDFSPRAKEILTAQFRPGQPGGRVAAESFDILTAAGYARDGEAIDTATCARRGAGVRNWML